MAQYTYAQLYALARKAGFKQADADIAAAIALAESQGNSLAHNPGNGSTDVENSYGLWQVNILAHPEYTPNQLEDPQQAASAAYALWKANGQSFVDWSTYNSGAYTHYQQSTVIQDYLEEGLATTGIGSGIGTVNSAYDSFLNTNPVGQVFNNIPFLKGLLSAPADFGQRALGVGFGLVLVVVGVITIAISGISKAAHTPGGEAVATTGATAAGGAAAGAGAAAALSATQPKASVREEQPHTPRRLGSPTRPIGGTKVVSHDPGDTQPSRTAVRLPGAEKRAEAAQAVRIRRKNPVAGSQTTLDRNVGEGGPGAGG